MSQNNVFPLSMPLNEKIALKSETIDELSRPSIAEAKKKMVVGLPSIQNNDNICEGCIYGKMHRLPFPKTA